MNEGCFLCHFFLYPNFPFTITEWQSAKPPILLYLYKKHVLFCKGKISLLFPETPMLIWWFQVSVYSWSSLFEPDLNSLATSFSVYKALIWPERFPSLDAECPAFTWLALHHHVDQIILIQRTLASYCLGLFCTDLFPIIPKNDQTLRMLWFQQLHWNNTKQKWNQEKLPLGD